MFILPLDKTKSKIPHPIDDDSEGDDDFHDEDYQSENEGKFVLQVMFVILYKKKDFIRVNNFVVQNC